MKSTEKSLALQITLVSFFVFLALISVVIGMSFLSALQSADRAIAGKVRNLSEGPKAIEQKMQHKEDDDDEQIIPPPQRGIGPREAIVLDRDGGIVRNNFYDLRKKDVKTLRNLPPNRTIKMHIADMEHLIHRSDMPSGESLYILENLAPIYAFHIRLFLIGLIGASLGLIVIYLLAQHLARMTIAPIQAHNRELESYSHNVAHELRTPLSIIRSNLELLALKNDTKYIASSDEEVANMEHIIESLLLLAKPESDGEKTQKEDIIPLTAYVVEKYSSEKNIYFTHRKTPITTEVNPELYKRMLTNLVENAIKYGTGDISIDLTHQYIHISNPVHKDLTKEEISHISDAFYQVDTSRSSSGYGLGLSLVAKIVELFGWKMTIRCEKCVFVVEIKMQ